MFIILCSIPKLLHPYFLRYREDLTYKFNNRKELVSFLLMVKLKEKKLQWALKQTNKKNKDLAFILGVKMRRFQQLKADYKRTGNVPKLNWKRRPKKEIEEWEKELIDKAVKESKITSAVKIRLYIKKYYDKSIPHNRIHKHLLKQGVARPDKKKQKQRKYCSYEREHSFSLGHMDWHESKAIPGKWVVVWEDDASRKIIAGAEFNHATTENSIIIVKEAQKIALEQYSAILIALNTDKGAQFYANKNNDKGERGMAEFERFLMEEGIEHIPSRRNHPQTNGKEERWFRTYNEKRNEFKSFEKFIEWYNNTIHLGLNRKEGITPNEAVLNKLRPESLIGLFFRRFE